MKKRYVIFALAAVELCSLPAGAKLISHNSDQFAKLTMTETKPSVIKIPTNRPGAAHYLVSTKQPFSLIVEDKAGNQYGAANTYKVQISQRGNIYGLEYGRRAQIPGDAESCRLNTSVESTILFESDKGTVRRRGSFKEQAVLVTVAYPEAAKPEFTFIHSQDANTYVSAPPCESPAL